MTRAWELPTSLSIGGKDYPIRTDYRAILDILVAFKDPDMEADERWMICFDILFEEPVPPELTDEAAKQAMWFINCGEDGDDDDRKPKPAVMDWEQDGHLILPAVNKVAGMEVRALPYLHWWTFMGYYMEIGEGTFSTVIGIRQKKAKGKKLEKWEQQFYRDNKAIVELKKKLTEEEQDELKRLEELWS